MYKAIVRSQVRKALHELSRGNFEHITSSFADDGRLQLMGSHGLGGERVGRAEVEKWFAEVAELFPDLLIEPEAILVNGPPWNMRVATRFRVSASLADGGRYENEGMQFLRLRMGKAVEDRLFEDTQVLADAIDRQRAAAATPA